MDEGTLLLLVLFIVIVEGGYIIPGWEDDGGGYIKGGAVGITGTGNPGCGGYMAEEGYITWVVVTVGITGLTGIGNPGCWGYTIGVAIGTVEYMAGGATVVVFDG